MSNKTYSTRKTTDSLIIGHPVDISVMNVLPTKVDVLRYFEWVRNQLKSEGCHQPERKVIAMHVARKLEEIWKKASIPVSSTNNIVFMILKLHERCEKIKKSSGCNPKNAKSFKTSFENFKSDIVNGLFDICSCKCKNLENCLCLAARKVPRLEHEFLNDQRSTRAMIIGGCDALESKKLKKRRTRQEKSLQSEQNRSLRLTKTKVLKHTESIIENHSLSHSSSDEVVFNSKILPPEDKPQSSSISIKQKLPENLPSFSRACDRRAISNRAGAQLASALLQDLNIVTPDNQAAVIDKSKVFRERVKYRQSISSTRTSEIIALYFDGRKDETISKVIVSGKCVHITKQEEHISLVEEPDSTYFGHVTPNSGSGKDIISSILKFMKENCIDAKTIKALGCDGTASNTGVSNGSIALFENALKHPVQAVVCLLHLNELPLRKIMVILDGPTSGPNSFSGPIGKQLTSCQDLPVVEYNKIDSVFPEVDFKELSTDQKYLWDICQATLTGECPKELERRNPGNISHARWLTLANRILRLYIATRNPTPKLKNLAEFIMKVYAPSWFTIKYHPRIIYASQNFFNIVRSIKYLEDDLKAAVASTLQRNAFMVHPEHLLLGMLFDSRKHIRCLALKRIQKARQTKLKAKRVFKPPQVNFEAKDYIDLIDWQSTTVTEPPLLMNLSTEELDLIVETGTSDRKEFKIPSHTQAVERIVKEVTEASKHVCGFKERDGFIRSRLLDRKYLPKFETKCHFSSATAAIQK